MSKLPNDLVEISSYNGRQGTVELNGLMYSPSEKALYNKGFLNKKININNKRNFYSYIKSENPRERKRICINLNSFLKQYPEYECIKEATPAKANKNVENDKEKKSEKNKDEKSDQKNEDQNNENNNEDISIDISIGEKTNENNNDNNNENEDNSNGIDENQFLDILNNYKD